MTPTLTIIMMLLFHLLFWYEYKIAPMKSNTAVPKLNHLKKCISRVVCPHFVFSVCFVLMLHKEIILGEMHLTNDKYAKLTLWADNFLAESMDACGFR